MTRVRQCGTRAALVELDSMTEVTGMHAALCREPLPGVIEVVPAARTLLLCYDPSVIRFDEIATQLARRPIPPADQIESTRVELRVRYDGADLHQVAESTGLTVGEVIRRHAAGAYVSAFCGFAPGFAYLAGLDPALHVRRRDSPRTHVGAGSVAIADEFTAVYPRESPGGWQVVGHTDTALWDIDRDPPTLLAPGVRVRFVPEP